MKRPTDTPRFAGRGPRGAVPWVLLVALALLPWSAGRAQAQTTVTLYPTTTATSGTVTSAAEALTDNNTGASISSNTSSLVLSGFSLPACPTASITGIKAYVKYGAANFSNDTYTFQAALDGTTFDQTILATNSNNVTPWVTAPALPPNGFALTGSFTCANLATLALRVATTRQGGADAGAAVSWDVGYIEVTYTSAANSTPTAAAGNIAGADDPILAGIQYSLSARYSDADGASNLANLYLAIDRDGTGTPSAPNDIVVRVTQGAAASGNATVDAGAAYLLGNVTYSKTEGSPTANDVTVTWTFTLGWNWFDDEPTLAEYAVRATDDSAADSGWSLTNIDVDYENDLNFSGTLSVTGAVNGAITCGSTWAQGTESLTWSGLTVVYDSYSTQPADASFDIQITDDDTGSWSQTTGAVLNLGTTTDPTTDISDIHNVDIVGIPAGGSDVSAQSCEIKVDATLPETLAGVAAGSPTSSSITLTWTAYGGGDTGAVGDSGFQTYKVYYSTTTPVTTGGSTWTSANDASLATSTTATTTITGLSPSTPYYFRIVGRDQAENESIFASATEVTATTTAVSGNPTASAGNITGADDPILAGLSYSLSAVYSDPNGAADLADLYLAIDRDGIGPPDATEPPTSDDIVVHVTQGAAASGNATVDAGAAYLIGNVTYSKTEGSPTANDVTVTWTFTLGWNWFDDEPTLAEYAVRATDDSAADSGWSLTNIDVDYENDLNFSGTLSVTGAVNGAITCGSTWAQGTESLTWSGLTVVYDSYSTQPADASFDIQITDDDTGSWSQTTGAVLNLGTVTDPTTDVSDIHNVDIVGIPAGGSDVSAQSCEIKVDATLPETLAGVAAGSPTSSSITLTWTAYGGGDTGAVGDSTFQTYKVYYSTTTPVTTGGSTWTSANDASLATSTTATTTITGLSSSTPYYFRIVGRDQAENESTFASAAEVTATTTAGAGDNLLVSQNTPIRATDVTAGEAGVAMQRFRVDSDTTGDGSLVLTSLTVEDRGTATVADIAAVTVYVDTDTSFAGAVQIGTAAFGADPTSVTLNGGTVGDRTVSSGASKYVWVVYDVAGGATAGATIQSRVTDIGVQAPDTGITGEALDSNLLTIVGASVNGTTVTANSGVVSSCKQITVTSEFTGDDNGNGSTLVQYDPNGGSTWTTACATVTGPSPRQCLIVDAALTGKPSVTVRVAYTDGDGVTGNPPIGPFSVPACGSDTEAPTVLVLSPQRDAVVGGTDKVKVQVFDSSGQLAASNPVQWRVDSGALSATGVAVNGAYDCGSNCWVYEFSLDTTGLNNAEHGLTVDVTDLAGNRARVERPFSVRNRLSGQPGGSGQLLRRSFGSQLCQDCHKAKTHSSQQTSRKYGNWALDCLTCHTPHATKNIFLIRESIRTPNSGVRPVRFENTNGAVNNSTVAGTASFTNEDNATQADGPCQVCHTRTQANDGKQRWRNTTAGGNQDTHWRSQDQTPCTNCHSHASGFKPGGACSGCHFGATAPAVVAGRRDVQQDFTRRSHHVGAGGAAMGGTLTDYDCVVCHAEGTISAGDPTTTIWHNDGNCDGGANCIDLKDADYWSSATPDQNVFHYDRPRLENNIATIAEWGSGDNNWRTQTSQNLDPFCLTCHDYDGATSTRNADTTTDTCASPNALNPFCDTQITNDYDGYNRTRVTDIASRVAQAWRSGQRCSATTTRGCLVNGDCPGGETCVAGAYPSQDRDRTTDPRYTEATAGADGIPDPPQGIYSRHAIRESTVAWGTTSVSGASPTYQNATDANGDIPAGYWIQTLNTWEDNSVMGCADCHTTDGANGASGNAHGSPSEYLLKDSGGFATLATIDVKAGTGTYICYRCHDVQNYIGPWDSKNNVGHTGNSSDWENAVGLDAPTRVASGTNRNLYGMACMNCHGGVEGGTQASPAAAQFGTIHGTSQTYGTGDSGASGTRQAYRFMNGNSMRYYDPGGWSKGATVTCYTIDSTEEDAFGACSQHNGGADFGKVGKPVQRDLKY